MKTLLMLISASLFSSQLLFAEEKVEIPKDENKAVEETQVENDYEQDTVFSSSGNVENGGYGAVVTSWGKVLDKDARFSGARGAWIINHSFTLGGGFVGMSNDMDAPNDELDRKLNFGYGGLILGYTFASHKLMHLHTNLMIGGGAVAAHEDFDKDSDCDDKNMLDDTVAVLEPELLLEFNINSWFRIGAGASYRYVQGASILGMEDEDFSGANALLTFKFGSY